MIPCILQVEDEETDIEIMRFVFDRVGITNPLHVVTDGQTAIDYVSGAGDFADRSKHPLPSLILLDLNLPKVSGLEFLTWLRDQAGLRHIVVIVFSSSSEPDDLRRAYDLGANCFIQKPVSISSTMEMVKAFKSWWLDWNHFPPVCETSPHP